MQDLKITLHEVVVAFAAAALSGSVLGYLISRSAYLVRVFEPLFSGIYAIPAILFFPVYVLIFGLGPASKIAIGTTISFFPVVLSTIAGFAYVDRILVVAARLAVGLLVGLHGFSRRSLLPIVLLLYATPQVTILPLFILYFGIGPASKIAFGMSHGMFPIIVTVAAGVQNIKPILLLSARSMGASPRQVLRWVIFPHMIPSFFTGMRLAMTAALLGVLLAELYVSSTGVGYFTHLFADSFEPAKLFGLITVLALMAIVLNETVRRAEVRFGHWQLT